MPKRRPSKKVSIGGVLVCFDAEEWRRIKRAAKQMSLTEAAFIRRAIDAWIAEQLLKGGVHA
jgi:hypothetical protein